MNSIDEFMLHQQANRRWAPQRTFRSLQHRVRRMFKRRLRGESRRQWIERNLTDSEAGVVFDIGQCIIGLLMVQSIISQNWFGSNYSRQQGHRFIDTANLIAITLNFGIRFYAAANRKAFCLHWLSIIDVCCWIPLFAEVALPDDDERHNKYQYRFFLMIRTLRLLQIFRLRRLAKSAKSRQGILIGLIAICIIICAAAAFQTIEYCDASTTGQIPNVNCQDLSFFDSIYFVCITIGTVGYGEYAPKTKFGKFADILLIIFTGILIPTQISAFTDILSRETAFDKKYHPDKRIQHILLCGDIENSSLNFFLHSWLHGEGERGNLRKVIILSPSLPSSSVRRVLIHREYEQRLLYLQGSAMDANDLQRAGAPTATYCFVMVNKHSCSLDEDDTATNLVTCSIRKTNRHAPLYVQVSKADNIRHINISGASAVVCLEQLKLSLFAKSMWIRGLNTFLGNMVQRFNPLDDKGGFWIKEYISGCCHRIYEAAVPSFLFAMPTFRSLAILIYREFNVPVVGVRTLQESVLVYPISKDLDDIAFHSVFFLSKSRDTITKIEKMSSAVFSRHPDISPNVDVSTGKSNRTITNVFASMSVAALEVNFNPFQRLSVAISGDTRRGSTMSVPRGIINSARPSARGNDKITPLGRDDEFGDSPALSDRPVNPVNNSSSSPPRLSKKGINGERVRHPSSVRDEEDDARAKTLTDSDSADIPFAHPIVPVIALSPAELMKKATSPHSARGSAGRPMITPRSPRTGSPRRTEAHKPSDPGPTLSAINHPQAPVSAKSVDMSNTSLDSRAPVVESNGPLLSSIQAAHPPHLALLPPSKSLTEATDEGRDDDDLIDDDRRESLPVIGRRSSVQRDPSRFSRSSKYRSFRRRSPPKHLTGHYVICGIPTNYHLLMSSLHDLDEPNPSVVFVTPRDLCEKDFATYVEFKSVYFVRGSPVSTEIFEEARMLHAKSILIMSYCGQETGDEMQGNTEQFDENMADVDAITTHRFISEACQNHLQRTSSSQPPPTARTNQRTSLLPHHPLIPYLVVEMMRPSNVKFLVDRSGGQYDETSAVNEMRVREVLRDIRALDDSFFSPLYAGGHIYFSNFMDALLGSSSQNAYLIDMITQLVISGNTSMNQSDRDARSKHRLSQIPAPSRYHNRPYALLVEGLLVNDNTVALGVYRAAHGFMAPAYVITNPAPTDLVHAHDLIFVIK